MGLVTCPECGTELSRSQTRCPHCGKGFIEGSELIVAVIVGGLLFMFLLAFTALNGAMFF